MISLKQVGSVKWTDEDLRKSLAEFAKIYKKRPIIDNLGGMKTPHMFPVWFTTRYLNPKHIVESGVWKGQSTWILEQACPSANIYSVDVNLRNRQYISSSPLVKYFGHDMFTDNFLNDLPREDTLIFFDDHQNMFDRLQKSKDMGFIHWMDDDNYPVGQGDCFSPKQAFESTEHIEWLNKNLEVYYEFPPIFKDKLTRWGDNWDENYPTKNPLLKITENYSDEFQIFKDEYTDYTWICYGKLKI